MLSGVRVGGGEEGEAPRAVNDSLHGERRRRRMRLEETTVTEENRKIASRCHGCDGGRTDNDERVAWSSSPGGDARPRAPSGDGHPRALTFLFLLDRRLPVGLLGRATRQRLAAASGARTRHRRERGEEMELMKGASCHHPGLVPEMGETPQER